MQRFRQRLIIQSVSCKEARRLLRPSGGTASLVNDRRRITTNGITVNGEIAQNGAEISSHLIHTAVLLAITPD